MNSLSTIAVSLVLLFACKSRNSELKQDTLAATAATPTLLEYQEFAVSPVGDYPMNHGSTLTDLRNGELLACWFAGKRETGPEVKIPCSRFNLSASSPGWGPPRVAVDAGETVRGGLLKNKFIGNPSLFTDANGKVWLFHEAAQAFGHSGAAINYKISSDRGHNWSEAERLVGTPPNFGHLPRNKARQLTSGLFILPVYREIGFHYGYTMLMDANASLSGNTPVVRTSVIAGKEHVQPSLVFQTRPQSEGGTRYIRAYLRPKDQEIVITSTMEFSDYKWSAPVPTNLPNPDAAVDAIETPSGGVLMVYNPSISTRDTLSLAYSTDGVQFTKIHDIVTEGGKESSYPAIITDSQGRYHVTYTSQQRATIKHVTFTQAWLDTAIASAKPTN